MRSLVRWAVNNSPAMNVAVIASLIAGLVSFAMLRRETLPGV